MPNQKLPELPELKFEEQTHTYTLNSAKLPSVTTVMRPLSNTCYGGIDKAVLNEAAKRGTAVHQAIENFLLYEIDDCPIELGGYYRAFKAWFTETKPLVLATETKIYHKFFRYACTADLLCLIDGKVTLIDFKTTTVSIDALLRVQLHAYERAFSSHGFEIEQKSALLLGKDGEWHFKYFPKSNTETHEVFASLLALENYKQKYFKEAAL